MKIDKGSCYPANMTLRSTVAPTARPASSPI